MELNVKEEINQYIQKAKTAQVILAQLTQEEIDAAVKAVAKAVFDHADLLAEMAVEETSMGNIADKTLNNQSSANMIWHDLEEKPSKVIIKGEQKTGSAQIPKLKGVVVAIASSIDPIATPMSHATFALKGGNTIILIPHPEAISCSAKMVQLMNDELRKLGLPERLIQVVDPQSEEDLIMLVDSADLVITLGKTDRDRVASRLEKPMIEHSMANVQCIIDRDADLKEIIPKIVQSRAFDNGLDRLSTQSIICPEEMRWEILDQFDKGEGHVIRTRDETMVLRNTIFEDREMRQCAMGQSAEVLGMISGIAIPSEAKVIVVFGIEPGAADLFSKAKTCPVLSVYSYQEFDEAVEIAEQNLEVEGNRHHISLSSNIKQHIGG